MAVGLIPVIQIGNDCVRKCTGTKFGDCTVNQLVGFCEDAARCCNTPLPSHFTFPLEGAQEEGRGVVKEVKENTSAQPAHKAAGLAQICTISLHWLRVSGGFGMDKVIQEPTYLVDILMSTDMKADCVCGCHDHRRATVMYIFREMITGKPSSKEK